MKKKIISIVLSVMMCLGASMTAFAANTTANATTGANDPASAASVTHTYVAYQIIKGNISDGKLVDVKWGSAADGENNKVQAVIKSMVTPIDASKNAVDPTKAKVEDYVRGIAESYDDSTTIGTGAELLAAAINQAVTGDGLAITNNKIEGDETGWYLIVDKTEGLGGDYAVYLDRAQLQLFVKGGEVTIVPKRSEITVNKEVLDINDTADHARVTYKDADWGEDADYDFGDKVPFRVTGTLPADFDTYKSYVYTFADKQSVGLIFDETSVKVYKNTIEDTNVIDSKYYDVTKDDNKHSFKVTFANLKADGLNLVSTDKLILFYESTLTGEGVEYGFNGNKNECRIEFVNDKGGQGKTPWDIAIVFTFKPVINKTDGTAALKGAEFRFSKQYKDETANFGFRTVNEFKGDGTSTFEINGIDDGIYMIEETKAPAGYNSIEPRYFEVVADHSNGELNSLTVYEMTSEVKKDENGDDVLTLTRGDKLGSVDKDGKSEGNWQLFKTVDRTRKTEKAENFGNINIEVINKQGVVLPSTGGIGTTIFYIVGGVLVVGAVVLLIVRRKMGTTEEE